VWLVDYLDGLRNPDDHEVVTHVLLVLSGMRQLGNSMEWQSTYIKSLLYFMQSERPRRVRHAALRAVHDARSALASINFSEDEVLPSINMLLSGKKPFRAIRDVSLSSDPAFDATSIPFILPVSSSELPLRGLQMNSDVTSPGVHGTQPLSQIFCW
jgi:hypothetical protein